MNAHYKGAQQAAEVQIWLAVTENLATPILSLHIYIHTPSSYSHLL